VALPLLAMYSRGLTFRPQHRGQFAADVLQWSRGPFGPGQDQRALYAGQDEGGQ
jgi:hypothetical protein